ncbi:hypothetical protein [Rhodococcus koreensis]|uniref:magnesium chelatase subunit ChlI family protein n=1 Tax=Rhodococcus koreensis TaxID=99653 RepID=UPI002174F612|nr:hypothetical protein [Rhodococcus koreensis]
MKAERCRPRVPASAKQRQISLVRYPRALAVAWTVSDLAGLGMPGPEQVVTALGFRDRSFQ